MVPTYYVHLSMLPRNSSGKIDSSALPNPEESIGLSEYIAPQTEEEHALCALWSGYLGDKEVGMHSNFFDMGGHSLRAMSLLNEMKKRFSVCLLYTSPSPRDATLSRMPSSA